MEIAMFDLDEIDIFIPNTETMRDLLESLNYKITPINSKGNEDITKYASICFGEWVEQFTRFKQTNKLYYCTNRTTLTEDQSIFLFTILQLCPDCETFREALQQYINNNP